MKLYGVLLAQNEGDVIEDTLEFLRKMNVFETIFFFDLGSKDDTFIKAQRYKDILHNPQILNQVFTGKLKYDLLARHQSFYKEGDWLAIIDADEFYVDNPIELIKFAESEGSTSINTYQAQFMFTDFDLKNFENEDTSLPIYERRKYYLINWSEERFYKFIPGDRLFDNSRPCSRRLLNRHYQFRTPTQIKMRIKTRLENKRKAKNIPGRSPWVHVFSPNIKDYIISHKILHRYNGSEFEFGIPGAARWKDYFSKYANSTVLPQIAVALMTERASQESAIDVKQKSINTSKETVKTRKETNSGKIHFENNYGKLVIGEIFKDIEEHEWKHSAQGLWVLLRYFLRSCLRQIYQKDTHIIREI